MVLNFPFRLNKFVCVHSLFSSFFSSLSSARPSLLLSQFLSFAHCCSQIISFVSGDGRTLLLRVAAAAHTDRKRDPNKKIYVAFLYAMVVFVVAVIGGILVVVIHIFIGFVFHFRSFFRQMFASPVKCCRK